jgi:hypothetical protein
VLPGASHLRIRRQAEALRSGIVCVAHGEGHGRGLGSLSRHQGGMLEGLPLALGLPTARGGVP